MSGEAGGGYRYPDSEDGRPQRPAAKVCGHCGEVCDDWVWDEEDGEWQADFECWHHPPTGHEFLCSHHCWLEVHRPHCGGGSPCRKPEAS